MAVLLLERERYEVREVWYFGAKLGFRYNTERRGRGERAGEGPSLILYPPLHVLCKC